MSKTSTYDNTVLFLQTEHGRFLYPNGAIIHIHRPERDTPGFSSYPMYTVKRKFDGQVFTLSLREFGGKK